MKNILNFNDFLNESFQSNKDINIIADMLIELSIKRFLKEHKDELENVQFVYGDSHLELWNNVSFLEFLIPVGLSYNDIKHSKKISKETKTCFNLSKGLTLFYKKYNKNILGNYDNNRTINLFVDYSSSKYENIRKEIVLNPTYFNAYQFLKQYRSTLIHELQHYIDRWRSDMKYVDKNILNAHSQMDNNDNLDVYYKLSHEISARYTQTLSQINNREEFNDYLFDFKEKFLGWNLMSSDVKQRLIKRLSQHYHNINSKKDSKLSKEQINSILNNIKQKYNVNIIFDGKIIDIFDNDIIKKDYENIIKDLIKISNTYRYDLEIYPYPEIKVFLKQIGFKENKGKNIRYDISWSRWYYTSKRN